MNQQQLDQMNADADALFQQALGQGAAAPAASNGTAAQPSSNLSVQTGSDVPFAGAQVIASSHPEQPLGQPAAQGDNWLQVSSNPAMNAPQPNAAMQSQGMPQPTQAQQNWQTDPAQTQHLVAELQQVRQQVEALRQQSQQISVAANQGKDVAAAKQQVDSIREQLLAKLEVTDDDFDDIAELKGVVRQLLDQMPTAQQPAQTGEIEDGHGGRLNREYSDWVDLVRHPHYEAWVQQHPERIHINEYGNFDEVTRMFNEFKAAVNWYGQAAHAPQPAMPSYQPQQTQQPQPYWHQPQQQQTQQPAPQGYYPQPHYPQPHYPQPHYPQQPAPMQQPQHYQYPQAGQGSGQVNPNDVALPLDLSQQPISGGNAMISPEQLSNLLDPSADPRGQQFGQHESSIDAILDSALQSMSF